MMLSTIDGLVESKPCILCKNLCTYVKLINVSVNPTLVQILKTTSLLPQPRSNYGMWIISKNIYKL